MGNEGYGQSIMFFSLLLLCGHSAPILHESLTWDAVLPKQIMHGLHSGCSSPSAAPTWLCTTGPAIQNHSGLSTQMAAPPPLFHCGFLSRGCSFSPRLFLSIGACPWTVPPPGLTSYCTKGPSITAGRDLLQTVPMDCKGNGLLRHGPLLSCRELLLCVWSPSCPFLCTDVGALRVCFSHISHTSLPAAQQFFPFLNLLSQRHTQCHSWLSTGQHWVPFKASWSWLLLMFGLFSELPHL